MSDKKGLSAFINKNKKAKKTKVTKDEAAPKDADQTQEANVKD